MKKDDVSSSSFVTTRMMLGESSFLAEGTLDADLNLLMEGGVCILKGEYHVWNPRVSVFQYGEIFGQPTVSQSLNVGDRVLCEVRQDNDLVIIIGSV